MLSRALRDCAYHFLKCFEPELGRSDLKKLLLLISEFVVIKVFKQQKLAAIEADTSKEFDEVSEETRVVHRRVQGYVAEVAWTDFHRRFAGEALSVLLDDTHARVIDRVEVRLECRLVIDQCRADLSHGETADQIWVHHAKLQCLYTMLIELG